MSVNKWAVTAVRRPNPMSFTCMIVAVSGRTRQFFFFFPILQRLQWLKCRIACGYIPFTKMYSRTTYPCNDVKTLGQGRRALISCKPRREGSPTRNFNPGTCMYVASHASLESFTYMEGYSLVHDTCTCPDGHYTRSGSPTSPTSPTVR